MEALLGALFPAARASVIGISRIITIAAISFGIPVTDPDKK